MSQARRPGDPLPWPLATRHEPRCVATPRSPEAPVSGENVAHYEREQLPAHPRVLNTNLDGKVKVMFALTSIKGVGRRFSNIACKKAEVDLNKR